MQNSKDFLKNFIKQTIKPNKNKKLNVSSSEFKDSINNIFQTFLNTILEVEQETFLNYEKNRKNIKSDNRRNGFSHKNVLHNQQSMQIKIPRDRKGEFEPIIVKKHQTNVDDITGTVMSLFRCGVSYEDISSTIKQIYNKKLSISRISQITDTLIPKNQHLKNKTFRSILCSYFYWWISR